MSPVPRCVPLLAALTLLVGCTAEPSGPSAHFPSGSSSAVSPTVGTSQPPAPLPHRQAEVVYVSDGDTIGIRFLVKGRPEEPVRPVRLLGIDTPETKDPDTGVECGGPAASRALTRLLSRGTRISLVADPAEDRTDKFGRLLRYVDRLRTGDVALVLLRRGLARYYVYHHAGARYDRYQQVEAAARRAGRGSWSACPDFAD